MVRLRWHGSQGEGRQAVTRALIFDCDGVLADTERDGHLPAFNDTFAHFNLPVHWSEEDYAEKVRIGGGKERLGGITKQGDRYLRQMLVVGALAVVRYAVRNGTRRPWLVQLLARRTPKVAAVALANKTARTVWAIMASGERYREPLAA